MTDVYGSQENSVSEPFRDDLTKIKGIGATTAERLYNAKIVTVKQIAEMTSEKLSETPGVGLVTAIKLIAAAKSYLSSSQPEGIAKNSPLVVPSVKGESSSKIIDKYDIAEVIIDEIEETSEESRKDVEKDVEPSQTDQKWFPDKFNYSRLTASYPPISDQAENIDNKVEEEHAIIEYNEEENSSIHAENEDVSRQEIIPEIHSRQDQSEPKNSIEDQEVDYTSIEPKIIDFGDSRGKTSESSIHQQIRNIFRNIGCYEIPRKLDSLNLFTSNLDYLGCKLISASDNLKFLFLFPVKWLDEEGTVLVDEVKLEFKPYENKNDYGAHSNLEQISRQLLRVRDSMYEDMMNHHNIREFFQKYLQLPLSLESGLGYKNLIFLSGTTQYKIVIEPILLCNNPPRSMEKSLAFPYQKITNLHAVTTLDLAPLIRFLEKKYRMIEKRTKKTNSVKDYQHSEEKFHASVKYASIPIFGYSAALMFLYFAGMYYLLRLFNTIGLALIGIYIAVLLFFYFNFSRIKKQVTTQFKTPYYLQKLEFSEIDLLDFKEDLTDELLAQFGYECLGKDIKFGVLEQSETNALRQSVEEKRTEPIIQNLFETEQSKPETVSNLTTKYNVKYSSFLDDP